MITFSDEMALICAIPSKSQNGIYLVRVDPAGEELVISHTCPASAFGKSCLHVAEAVSLYERWQWWEPKKRIRTEVRRIVLQPHWQQIQLPSSPIDIIRLVIRDAS